MAYQVACGATSSPSFAAVAAVYDPRQDARYALLRAGLSRNEFLRELALHRSYDYGILLKQNPCRRTQSGRACTSKKAQTLPGLFCWYTRQDSNLRPLAPQANALSS